MTTETDIKPGETVRLKSGGPRMTVTQVGEAHMTGVMTVWCQWFEGTKLHEGEFVFEAIEKIARATRDPTDRPIRDLVGSRF